MAEHYVKNLGKPDEVIEFPLVKVRVVDLGDITGVYELKGLEGERRLARFVPEGSRA